MRYRKKPVEIEATRLTTDSFRRIIEWLNAERVNFEVQPNNAISIITLEGAMLAAQGDWIIKGIKGEFYPCKPDIFNATYEKVEPWMSDFSEEDMIVVTAARKVAAAFGKALFSTIHRDMPENKSPKELWESFADELCEFVNLVED
jgi:hypothetical protein